MARKPGTNPSAIRNRAAKTAAVRGIFNYYPLEQAKIGSLIVARFMDPAAKMNKDGTQMPYIVATDPASNWHNDTPHDAGGDVDRALAPLADRLADRAAPILA